MSDPLQAISNVIELKPDKAYLLVFKMGYPANESDMGEILEALRAEGIHSVGIALSDGQELTVIEAPNAQEEADESPLFLGGE